MFICIGPICIPLWGVLPFLLIAWKTVYRWVTGRSWEDKAEGTETVWAAAVEAKAATVGETEQARHTRPGVDVPADADVSELRRRAGGGAVRAIGSLDGWVDTLAHSKVHGTAVLVKFTASWCKPCQRIAPLFAELAASTAQTDFVEVDVDERKDVAEGAGAPFTLPTFQVYKGSVRVATMSGASPDALRKLVEDNCKKSS